MDIDICREYGQVGKLFFRFIKAKICRCLYVAYMYFGCIRFSMSVPPHPFVFTGCGSAGWQGRWKTGHCSSLSTLCPLSSAPQYSLSDLHTLPLCANVQWTDFVRSQYSSKSMLLAEVKKNYLKLDAREEMCSASISIAHPHTQWVFFWDRPGWLLPNFVLVLPCAAHSSEWWWGRRGLALPSGRGSQPGLKLGPEVSSPSSFRLPHPQLDLADALQNLKKFLPYKS